MAFCAEEKPSDFDIVFKNDKSLQSSAKRVTSKIEKENAKLVMVQKKHKETIAKYQKELIKVYESTVKKYTKKGDLRAANAILAQIDKMKNEDTQEQIDEALGVDSKGGKSGILYVCCDDSCKISLNGEIIIATTDSNWKKVLEKEITLKKGDIITVMAANGQNDRGFSAVFVPHNDGQPIVSDNKWKIYHPKTGEWWKFKPGRSDRLAVKGSNQSMPNILSLKTDIKVKIDSIWGNDASCHLYRIISSKDIK